MTEQEAKIKELELRVKKLEDKVFDTFLNQYDSDVDISEEPWDPEPWIPTQGASIEMVEKAIEEHKKWEERQNNFKGKFVVD